MFWTRRQPISSVALDSLVGLPENDRRALADRMVQSGEWRQADAELAFRIARRLEAFAEAPKRADLPG